VKGLVPVDNDRCGRPREHPQTSSSSPNFQGKPYVWWRHFRSKCPTRADIAQLPVAHAHPKGTPLWSRDLRSLPVAMVLVLLYYILSCCACAEHTSGYDVTSGHVTHVTFGQGQFRSRDFRLLPIVPPQMLLCPYWYTTIR